MFRLDAGRTCCVAKNRAGRPEGIVGPEIRHFAGTPARFGGLVCKARKAPQVLQGKYEGRTETEQARPKHNQIKRKADWLLKICEWPMKVLRHLWKHFSVLLARANR